jgi:2-dehydropantoate 2-reductase
MNIVVFGAGAIGSLFGARLSKNNTVVLVGRKNHVNAIQKNGLKITGKTRMVVDVPAVETADGISFTPDLLMMTVKSYDTKKAIKQAKSLITRDTTILSLQNGLNNVEIIEEFIDRNQILAGVTTHGAVFSGPGLIEHMGSGWTTVGELSGKITERINGVASVFTDAGINTEVSGNIMRELWSKAVINSSINPLTAFFDCKNGYLLENPILENIVKRVCMESTEVAKAHGVDLSVEEMLRKTRQVICDTAENYSSMVQSVRRGGRSEIDAINGVLVDLGRTYNVDVFLNEVLVYLIRSIGDK